MTIVANLQFIAGIALAILGALGSGVLVYILGRVALRRLIRRESAESRERTTKLAEHVFKISGTLMALILSFSLNSLRNDYTSVRDSIQLEAAEVLDIATDLNSFGTEGARQLRRGLEKYVRLVIDEEWPSLAAGNGLAPDANRAFDDLQIGFHLLKADTPARQSLRANLISDIDEISDYRQHRGFQALPDPPQFLYVALVGFLCTIATLVVYEPTVLRILLIAAYSAFVGLVVHSMLALSLPFSGEMGLSPEPLIRILEQISAM